MLMPIRFVVEAWAMVGVQSSHEIPFRVTILAPEGVPVARLKLNLLPFVTGGLIRNRKVVLGKIVAFVSGTGATTVWVTVTPKDTLVELLVGWASLTVTVIVAEPKLLVVDANANVPVAAGLA